MDTNSDDIEVIQSSNLPTNNLSAEDVASKRIIAEAMRHGGLKEIFIGAQGGKKVTQAEWLSTMVWDGVTQREIIFADGAKFVVEDVKEWLALVKFLAGHLDGPVNPNALIGTMNFFKTYIGFDTDKVGQ
jgi:hypothetical protein